MCNHPSSIAPNASTIAGLRSMSTEHLNELLAGLRSTYAEERAVDNREAMAKIRGMGDEVNKVLHHRRNAMKHAERAPTQAAETLKLHVNLLTDNLSNLSGSDREFAESLLGSYRANRLSEKQALWIGRLALRAENPATKPGETSKGGPGPFTPLVEFMARATENGGIKYPKIRLNLDGKRLVLSRAGDTSRNPGSIHVKLNDEYLGSIGVNGSPYSQHTFPEAVEAELKAIAENPAERALAHGKATGNCCFCARELEDYRSVSKGYGPICAQRYGLPWGEVDGNPSEYTEQA